ncbi:MAG: hypothetical protein J6Z01_12575 [Bacteroidales bacterium]|nr:hypothetical protein [Bacteroidales bacterium]
MKKEALDGLLSYLLETLSYDEMRYLGDELRWHSDDGNPMFRPYTMEEVNAMLDEAEKEIAEGKGIPHEEFMKELDEEFRKYDEFKEKYIDKKSPAHKKQKMCEAV